MNNNISNVEILAIGAHPDDVELGCGGTIAKMVSLGHSVGILDLTKGEMGTRGNVDIRKKESDNAAKILGIKFRHALSMPDSELQVTPENEHKLVEIIRSVKPKIVFAPLYGNTHPDHSAASDLIESVWYKSGFGKYKSSLEPFRPQRLIRYMLGQNKEPSFIVDISKFFETRNNAILAYKSQFHTDDINKYEGKTKISSPKFLEDLNTKIKYYGLRILKDYGEPFFINEVPEIENPATLNDTNTVF